MPSKGHYPAQQQPDVKPAEMALLVADIESLRQQTIPQTAEELEQRIKWFFGWCVEHRRRPTVELMALACGTSRQNLWKWQQSGGSRGEVISRAKQLLAALMETWMIEGKVNPIPAIFLLKNHFGYSDTYQFHAEPKERVYEGLSPEEIARRIEQDIPLPDDTAEGIDV